MFKILKALRGVIGKIPVLAMAPDHFHGVEIRSVRRQPLNHDPATLCKPGFHLLCPMGLSPVPDERESLGQVSPQPLKESKHFCATDVVGILSPVKTKPPSKRCQRDRANGGEPITAIPLAQNGRLPSRGPRTPNQRLEHKAAFIDKDHASTGSPGVFLYGATVPSATFRWPPRLSLVLGAPASDSSTLHLVGLSIHARGDNGLRRCGR
jgi:hypothetical protein